MKKLITISIISSVISIISAISIISEVDAATINSSNSASYKQNAGINRGLLGWWTFDGADRLLDKSGQGYTGSNVGGAVYGMGKVGQGIGLNGSTAYIDSGHDYSWTKTQPFTIATWFIMDDTNTRPLITKENYEYSLTFNEGLNTMSFTYWDSGGTDSIRLTATAVTTNAWHHAVITYDGANNSAMYLDGVLKSTDTTVTANPFRDVAENTKIGFGYAYGGGPSKYFDGAADDVRVYNRTLSPSEIKQLYNAGAGGKTNSSFTPERTTLGVNSGLVGYWTMDGADVNGVAVSDKSGNANTGTAAGGVTKTMGKIGQAMNFSGSGQYISPFTSSRFITVANIFANGLTYGAWIKTAGVWEGIVGQSASIGYSYFSTCGLMIDGDGFLWIVSYEPGDNYYEAISAIKVNNNNWHYVVGTFNPSDKKFRVYIDGIFSGISGHAFTTMTEANYAVIGAVLKDNGPQYFNGNIDDVRIYNRALSVSEVKQLYAMGAGGKTNASITPEKTTLGVNSGLVGYWTFDGADIVGMQVYDKSGGFATGTTYGSVIKTMGKIGQATKFRESTTPADYIDVGAPSRLELYSNFTMSAWVSPTKNPANDVFILSKDYNTGARGYGFGLHFDRTIYLEANGAIVFGTVGTAIPINSWSLITIVHNGSAWLVYQNGSYVNQSTNFISVSPNSSAHWYINGRHFGAGNFQGAAAKIDDARIYNRALSAAEITQLYNMGK